MSNLIKSGRVVDLGIPVNVGVSYTFNSSKNAIVEKKVAATSQKVVTQKEDAKNEEKKKEELSSPKPQEPVVSKEEIINKYMEEAKKKAEELYQAELKRAYDEAMAKAEADSIEIIENAKLERENILEDVVKLKEDTTNEAKEELKNLEKDIIDLSLDIVEKIINYEVNRSDDYVLGIVKDALDKVLSKKDVVLKLSTADYYTVLSNKKYLVANVKGFGEIDIVQDESMEPGGCIVDTPLGVIDGGLQVRMDNIQKEVMKMLCE